MDDQWVAAVPAGRWAVGVSGGADSVALLLLLQRRTDLLLHVVHLDHQTRNGQSAEDARFVAELAGRLNLPCTIALRDRINSPLLKNLSARFRAARLALFKQVVAEHQLSGVILAHHADDQAETVMQRLLRGAGPTALSGMSPRIMIDGLCILRPLLQVSSADLRQFLQNQNQPWRQDISNASPKYLRNRLRPILAADGSLRESLLQLAGTCRRLRKWIRAAAPTLAEEFRADQLASLPLPLARQAACRWFVDRGVPADRVTAAACDRLVAMAGDAATAGRQHFPTGLLIRRRRGIISPAGSPPSAPASAGRQVSPFRSDST